MFIIIEPRAGGASLLKAWPVSSSTALGISSSIIHGPAHRGANGAAMPTGEDDQVGLFLFD